jgi:hypothetical protein
MSSKINRSQTTVLSDPINYNVENIVFDEPTENNIPGSTLKFFRVNVGTKNPNGTEGNLVLKLDKCMSYGLQETRDMQTGVLNGYSISLCMKDKEGATERQEKTLDVFTKIVEKCKDHLLSVRTKIKKFDLERNDLKKLNPMYMKRKEDGQIDENAIPTLYPKLLYYKSRKDKNGNEIPAKIGSVFYNEDEVDEEGNPMEVDPMVFLGKRCLVTAALKVESIFVGKDIKLQCKLIEADVKSLDTKPKRLLRSFVCNDEPIVSNSGNNPLIDDDEEENEIVQPVVEEKKEELLAASDDEDDGKKKKKKIVKKK